MNKYFMLNAVVAKEAYDGTEFTTDMIHSEYQYCKDVHDGRIMAGEWHRLFSATNDLRRTLTWEDEFASVAPIAYNFYSSGDQVFDAHPGGNNPDPFEGAWNASSGHYAWAFQEKRKGESVFNGGGDYTFSSYGGWSFDKNNWGSWVVVAPVGTYWVKPPASDLEQESENVFKMTPLFNTGGATTNLCNATAAQTFIDDSDHRIRLLSGFIPATSFAAGHASIAEKTGVKLNFNMNLLRHETLWPRLGEQYEWKQGWWHSDIKDVAFSYTHALFERIITEAE